MPAPLRIPLTPEEDARLWELETNPVVPFKVRRRAQAVRLAAQGWTAPRIARYLGLDRTTLHRDLRRWPERVHDRDTVRRGGRGGWLPIKIAGVEARV
jgi:hypothetical protein